MKNLEKQVSTIIQSVQHPNAGQNIQNRLIKKFVLFTWKHDIHCGTDQEEDFQLKRLLESTSDEEGKDFPEIFLKKVENNC